MQFGIIIKSETWDKSYHCEGWLETNIKKNYLPMRDENLKKTLIDNDIINSYYYYYNSSVKI